MSNILREVINFDRSRRSFSGEHWWVAAAGLALCGSALKRRGSAHRVLALVAGTTLLYRAASGRDGLAGLMRGRSLAQRTIGQLERPEPIGNATASDDARGTAAFADSPNEAERLQRSGEFGVGAGIAVEVVEETPDDPNAKAGQEKIVPGLPDFMRGG